MRITTNSMVRNYNSALSASASNLNYSREKVYTGRQFTKAYQDPAGSLRAADLHRKYLRTETNISTVDDALGRLDTADSSLQQMTKLVGDTILDDGLKGLSGSSSEESRKTYANSLRQMQQSLLQFANSSYGGKYMFAGADGANAPFAIDDAGNVSYRGIDVTTGAWANGTEAAGLAELERLADEKLYLDIGLGMQVDTANGVAGGSDDINGASAYNASLPGIKALGFGSVPGTTPPISQNVIALVGQMADELEKPDFDAKHFGDMFTQLQASHSDMADFNSEIGVKTTYLENTKTRLEDEQENLYQQIDLVVNVDPAEAIMEYSFSQYSYNMILKVGTSLLSNSFIDFMK